MIPGEIVHPAGPVKGNLGRPTVELEVANTLDRAVQVTSHYHFFEANPALRFDREAAYGMRLDVPAGLGVRFEPGETRTVRLVPFGGRRVVRGFHGLVDGPLDDEEVRSRALERARARGLIG
jgi:urease beta subunit